MTLERYEEISLFLKIIFQVCHKNLSTNFVRNILVFGVISHKPSSIVSPKFFDLFYDVLKSLLDFIQTYLRKVDHFCGVFIR